MVICEEKSWLEVEMNASMDLLRKKLEKMNDLHVDDVSHTETMDFKNLYKTFYYIFFIDKHMDKIKLFEKTTCGSWLQTEMNESLTLLRKKLHEMNMMSVTDVGSTEVENFKNIYKTLYYMIQTTDLTKPA